LDEGEIIIAIRFNQEEYRVLCCRKGDYFRMNKSRRIFSIAHEQDVDGLFCGAILKNTFRNTLVFLTNHGYKNMKKAADLLERDVAQSETCDGGLQ
jgi:hypothetical protein